MREEIVHICIYRRIVLLSSILFLVFGQLCSQGVSTPCAGVLINGVCWAEHNVDAPGTFAATPEAYGMLYQWNRKKGWPATGAMVSGWDTSDEPSESWEAVNDPCPSGWRVPTREELATLLDEAKVTYTQTLKNGVNGKKFTDNTTGNAIFLPLTGFRASNGLMISPDNLGQYWSSSADSPNNAWIAFMSNSSETIAQQNYPKSFGNSVRCVTDADLAVTPLRDTIHDAVCYGEPYSAHGFTLPPVTADTLLRDTIQSAAACDSIITLSLTVYDAPSVSIAVSDSVLCAGDEVTLRAIAGKAGGAQPLAVAIGDIYCTDNTVVKPDDFPASGKTAKGIVFYVDRSGKHGWLVSPNKITTVPWAQTETVSIPGLPNYATPAEATRDTNGYSYTRLIREAGNAADYPAAYAVDFEAGWYIPTIAQIYLLTIHTNILNVTLNKVNGTILLPIDQLWSSIVLNNGPLLYDIMFGIRYINGWNTTAKSILNIRYICAF